MTATITNMKFVYADLLTPSQLMEGDLINIDNDIVEVISIVDDATGDNYTITHRNDYGEEEETTCTYEDMFKLYVFIDEDEQGPGAPNVRFDLIKTKLYFSHFSDKINI